MKDSPGSSVSTEGMERRELWLILGITLLGVAVRFWGLGGHALDHFDEGVYVFSALGLTDRTQPLTLYPDQQLFAPLGIVILLAASFKVFGAGALSALAVNAGLGSATVPLLWWIGRRWFGGVAGLVAATLIAVDPLHIALSRSALTDVAFLAVFLVALALAVEALRRDHLAWAVLAGLAAGAAWNVKYHGWFAVVLAGCALVPRLLPGGRGRSGIARGVLLVGVMGLTAALCYLPWALYVQSLPGGYRALLDYQGTNVTGTWIGNLQIHVTQQAFLENTLSRIGLPLALLLSAWARPGDSGRAFLLTALAAGIGALLLGLAGTMLVLGLVGVLGAVFKDRDPASWLLAAWGALWMTSAPLYDPYARLLLPMWAAVALASGWWVTRVFAAAPRGIGGPPRWSVAAVGLALVGLLAGLRSGEEILPRTSADLASAAAAIAQNVPAGERVIVVGEPELAFYLHLDGRPAFERTENPARIAEVAEPVYVVSGRYVKRSTFLREGFEELTPRLERLGVWPVVPNVIRLLDDLRPQRAQEFLDHPDGEFDLTLYRLHPEGAR